MTRQLTEDDWKNIRRVLRNPVGNSPINKIKKDIIHLSNIGRYDENKAKIIGTWDIQAKNKTRCWLSTYHNDATVTDDINLVTCKRCLKIIKQLNIK